MTIDNVAPTAALSGAASVAEGHWLAAAQLAAIRFGFVLGSFAGALIAAGEGARSRSRVLLFEGLLAEDPNDGKPLVGLGDPEAVRAVYKAERRIEVRRAPPSAAASTRRRDRSGEGRNAALETMDADVRARFETLRAWRRERAAEQHVPPYVIFQDKTLLDIARAEPGTLDALGRISGVGQSKLDRYGAAVLAALAG